MSRGAECQWGARGGLGPERPYLTALTIAAIFDFCRATEFRW